MWEWDDRFPDQAAEVNNYVREIQRRVRDELQLHIDHRDTFGWTRKTLAESFPLGHGPEARAVDTLARVSYGFSKGTQVWVRDVDGPKGIIVSGSHFPDVIGAELVEAAHRYSLKNSPIFVSLYNELLKLLDEKFGHEHTEHSRVIKLELRGNYVLPPQPPELPVIKIEPKSAAPIQPEPPRAPVPTTAEVFNRLDQSLDAAARQYLMGVK
jgi:hypothetical protein